MHTGLREDEFSYDRRVPIASAPTSWPSLADLRQLVTLPITDIKGVVAPNKTLLFATDLAVRIWDGRMKEDEEAGDQDGGLSPSYVHMYVD